MGNTETRIVKILDLLASSTRIKITLLAEILDVSPVTLRKDLDYLEKKGVIRRSHGYASLDGADSTGKRMAYNHSIKRRIARAAVNTVEEGETIMLESGSCCALFAEELALSRKNAAIITNSAFVANYVSGLPAIKIILLGGVFQPESRVMVGRITEKCAENFSPDKFFLGADGFTAEHGFTGRDHQRVETAAELAKCAKKVFVLTEAEKFNRRGTYNLIHFNKVAGVFTDDSIPKEAETALLENNVKLHKVPFAEERIKWQQFPGMPPILYSEKEE
jgi:DeoR/GlpR family transcriptional regulator of sugar metabolism